MAAAHSVMTTEESVRIEIEALDRTPGIDPTLKQITRRLAEGCNVALIANQIAHYYLIKDNTNTPMFFKWSEKSAHLKNKASLYTLGGYYKDGVEGIVDINWKLAIDCYKKSWELYGEASDKDNNDFIERLNEIVEPYNLVNKKKPDDIAGIVGAFELLYNYYYKKSLHTELRALVVELKRQLDMLATSDLALCNHYRDKFLDIFISKNDWASVFLYYRIPDSKELVTLAKTDNILALYKLAESLKTSEHPRQRVCLYIKILFLTALLPSETYFAELKKNIESFLLEQSKTGREKDCRPLAAWALKVTDPTHPMFTVLKEVLSSPLPHTDILISMLLASAKDQELLEQYHRGISNCYDAPISSKEKSHTLQTAFIKPLKRKVDAYIYRHCEGKTEEKAEEKINLQHLLDAAAWLSEGVLHANKIKLTLCRRNYMILLADTNNMTEKTKCYKILQQTKIDKEIIKADNYLFCLTPDSKFNPKQAIIHFDNAKKSGEHTPLDQVRISILIIYAYSKISNESITAEDIRKAFEHYEAIIHFQNDAETLEEVIGTLRLLQPKINKLRIANPELFNQYGALLEKSDPNKKYQAEIDTYKAKPSEVPTPSFYPSLASPASTPAAPSPAVLTTTETKTAPLFPSLTQPASPAIPKTEEKRTSDIITGMVGAFELLYMHNRKKSLSTELLVIKVRKQLDETSDPSLCKLFQDQLETLFISNNDWSSIYLLNYCPGSKEKIILSAKADNILALYQLANILKNSLALHKLAGTLKTSDPRECVCLHIKILFLTALLPSETYFSELKKNIKSFLLEQSKTGREEDCRPLAAWALKIDEDNSILLTALKEILPSPLPHTDVIINMLLAGGNNKELLKQFQTGVEKCYKTIVSNEKQSATLSTAFVKALDTKINAYIYNPEGKAEEKTNLQCLLDAARWIAWYGTCNQDEDLKPIKRILYTSNYLALLDKTDSKQEKIDSYNTLKAVQNANLVLAYSHLFCLNNCLFDPKTAIMYLLQYMMAFGSDHPIFATSKIGILILKVYAYSKILTENVTADDIQAAFKDYETALTLSKNKPAILEEIINILRLLLPHINNKLGHSHPELFEQYAALLERSDPNKKYQAEIATYREKAKPREVLTSTSVYPSLASPTSTPVAPSPVVLTITEIKTVTPIAVQSAPLFPSLDSVSPETPRTETMPAPVVGQLEFIPLEIEMQMPEPMPPAESPLAFTLVEESTIDTPISTIATSMPLAESKEGFISVTKEKREEKIEEKGEEKRWKRIKQSISINSHRPPATAPWPIATASHLSTASPMQHTLNLFVKEDIKSLEAIARHDGELQEVAYRCLEDIAFKQDKENFHAAMRLIKITFDYNQPKEAFNHCGKFISKITDCGKPDLTLRYIPILIETLNAITDSQYLENKIKLLSTCETIYRTTLAFINEAKKSSACGSALFAAKSVRGCSSDNTPTQRRNSL